MRAAINKWGVFGIFFLFIIFTLADSLIWEAVKVYQFLLLLAIFGVDYMSNRWKGMFLPVSKPTCSSVVFSLRLRVFFRTESYNLIGTNWYLPTVLPSCLSLNFHPHYFVKYFYCRTLCLRGHPKRWRTRVGSRSMTVGRLQFVCLWNN